MAPAEPSLIILTDTRWRAYGKMLHDYEPDPTASNDAHPKAHIAEDAHPLRPLSQWLCSHQPISQPGGFGRKAPHSHDEPKSTCSLVKEQFPQPGAKKKRRNSRAQQFSRADDAVNPPQTAVVTNPTRDDQGVSNCGTEKISNRNPMSRRLGRNFISQTQTLNWFPSCY